MHFTGLFIGLTTIDIQHFVDEFPESNKKIKTNPPDILVGGPASNAAVAFSHLNNGAHLLTAVGVSSFSSFVQDDFHSVNINFTDLVEGQKVCPVIASVITSGNGDRNIFTYNPLQVHSEINIKNLFDKVKPQILLLDGFYPEVSLHCAQLAKQREIPVVMDCGSWKEQYDELLLYTDVAICSADFHPPNCPDSSAVFDFLLAKGISNIAISRGSESILYFDNNIKGEIEIENTIVADTLGAGDFLHGAFCYYLLKYNSFADALAEAAKLASFSCQFKGTRKWLQK